MAKFEALVEQVQTYLESQGWKVEFPSGRGCSEGRFLATKGSERWLVQVAPSDKAYDSQ